MNIPSHFPVWMFLYFAILGTIALVLLAAIYWTWMKTTRLTNGALRNGLAWNAVGNIFTFSAAWFACGIGAGPGNLLSTDVAMHQPFLATCAAVAGMLCSVVGWACLLVGIRKILNGLERGEIITS